MSVGVEDVLRQGRGLLAISYFPSAEVKLMRKARPSASRQSSMTSVSWSRIDVAAKGLIS
jgi:hypothetical protein